jgi:hypothetical protein
MTISAWWALVKPKRKNRLNTQAAKGKMRRKVSWNLSNAWPFAMCKAFFSLVLFDSYNKPEDHRIVCTMQTQGSSSGSTSVKGSLLKASPVRRESRLASKPVYSKIAFPCPARLPGRTLTRLDQEAFPVLANFLLL